MRTGATGFTLIELVVVLAVVGLVLVLAAPSYSVWIQNTKVRNGAESILNGLQLARSEALKRNTTMSFAVSADSGWLFGCLDPSGSCPASIQSRNAGEGSTGNVAVAAAGTTTANTVYFNSLGASVTEAGAAAPNVIEINVSTTVLSPTDRRPLRVLVDPGGAITMCDPTLSSTGSDPRACH